MNSPGVALRLRVEEKNMSKTVIKVENLSKQYRLGLVGTGTLSHDINRWWHLVRGKEDPYLKIGETNDRASRGNSEYVWALQDINFEVKEGEVLGIIGKNGAGKSTLLKLLSKVTAPTTGSIKAKGRIASLLEVGTGFHPELTGRENIYLNGTILGMSKAEVSSKLDEIVAFAGVERYLDTPVKRYSSGMTVRLGFAVAAHLEPEILIVDEVLAVGDAEFQRKAVGKMKEVSKEGGRTVLFVSHNMASVKKLCSKSILLDNGVIKEHGPTEFIVNRYLSKGSLNEKPYLKKKSYQIYSETILIKKIGYFDKVFHFTFFSKVLHERIAIVCKIYSTDEVLIFKTSTSPIWSTKNFPMKGECTFQLDIKQLNLIEGDYYIGLEVTSPNIKRILRIDNAFPFTVHYSNIYKGSKRLRIGEDGFIMAPHNWKKIS